MLITAEISTIVQKKVKGLPLKFKDESFCTIKFFHESSFLGTKHTWFMSILTYKHKKPHTKFLGSTLPPRTVGEGREHYRVGFGNPVSLWGLVDCAKTNHDVGERCTQVRYKIQKIQRIRPIGEIHFLPIFRHLTSSLVNWLKSELLELNLRTGVLNEINLTDKKALPWSKKYFDIITGPARTCELMNKRVNIMWEVLVGISKTPA